MIRRQLISFVYLFCRMKTALLILSMFHWFPLQFFHLCLFCRPVALSFHFYRPIYNTWNSSTRYVCRISFTLELSERLLKMLCYWPDMCTYIHIYYTYMQILMHLYYSCLFPFWTIICDPSDQNESHVINFGIWGLYIVSKTTSLALKWHQMPGSTITCTYLFDKVINDYMYTLWRLFIRDKLTKVYLFTWMVWKYHAKTIIVVIAIMHGI